MGDYATYMSKTKIAPYIEIDHTILNDIIMKEYGIHFNFVKSEEADNHTSNVFHVDGQLTSFCENKLKRWKETGEGIFMTMSLLNEMAQRGKLQRGNWIIRVQW